MRNGLPSSALPTSLESLTKLQLGPDTIAWVSEATILTSDEREQQTSIRFISGERNYELDIPSLLRSCDKASLPTNELRAQLSYKQSALLNIPPESLDEHPNSGLIIYSEHTARTLHASLTKYFQILHHRIQAEMHVKLPVQALHAYNNLIHGSYWFLDLAKLNWRGKSFDSIVTESKAEVFFLPSRSFDERRYPVSLAAATFEGLLELQLGDSKANSLVGGNYILKAPTMIAFDRIRTVLSQGDQYLDELLEKQGFRPEARERHNLFLLLQGDPLEQWIDGKEVFFIEESWVQVSRRAPRLKSPFSYRWGS